MEQIQIPRWPPFVQTTYCYFSTLRKPTSTRSPESDDFPFEWDPPFPSTKCLLFLGSHYTASRFAVARPSRTIGCPTDERKQIRGCCMCLAQNSSSILHRAPHPFSGPSSRFDSFWLHKVRAATGRAMKQITPFGLSQRKR